MAGELDSETARFPGLDIEVVHRRAAEDKAEQITINLTATPSFDAFGRALEAASPFAFWAQGLQLVWLPWLEAARAFGLPWLPTLPTNRENDSSSFSSEHHLPPR